MAIVHRGAPSDDPGERDLRVGEPEHAAAGTPAVLHALQHGVDQMGPVRTARTLLRLNQPTGFDCPGCAWPDPSSTHVAEFCENGAKAVAEEATVRRITPAFFAEHPVADLATRSDHWLGQQGRLTTPMVLRPGATHYEALSWDAALGLVATELDALHDAGTPDRAVFYTSGRTSNEAAFAYQLLVRVLGTNNLPDCSNMCHESSGLALSEAIGIGKGSVRLTDFAESELIVILGQNPGTNHPRMLSALEEAKEAGARIVAVNPLPEAGLLAFDNPQRPGGLVGRGTDLADAFLRIRLNGDLALLRAVNHLVLAAGAVDRPFVEQHCEGLADLEAELAELDWDEVLAATGLERAEIEALAADVIASERIIVCWAMGLTQHRNAVATIREAANLCLLRGAIGKAGAGLCPVRGHSNVQGDRTMGVWEKMPDAFLDALGEELGFEPPRTHGYDTVDSLRAMEDGEVDVFVGMGGNFVRATPDSTRTEAALQRCKLTVHVSTKLNRSHTVTGETALILPTLGRTERDRRAGGDQRVSVEDSMGMVHASVGRLAPAHPDLHSEVAIVCGIAARARFGRRAGIGWDGLAADYRHLRHHISRVVPGFERYEERLDQPGGFELPHPPRDSRTFTTPDGKAHLTVNPLEVVDVPDGHLLLQTLRSHDQYNTTIYGLDDRYRGIKGGRRVVFAHADDLAALRLADGSMVDLVSVWDDAVERRAESFRCVAYPIARGCAAAYFPETNVLVPRDSVAIGSGTPTSKSVVVRLEPAAR